MPCYHPLDAFQGISARTGKNVIHVRPKGVPRAVWLRDPKGSFLGLPCGQCVGCRLERSRQWAVRCVHEASLYDENVFLTLTYSDLELPKDLSLDKRHFQLFMKRLRDKCPGERIRYFQCGEYGEQTRRPHYHALLFNIDFPDKKIWKEERGNIYYRSDWLEARWKLGMVIIGSVTFESAAYVARYVMKKVTGDSDESRDLREKAYLRCDDDGVAYMVQPEYITMSRGSGIGTGWFELFGDEVFPEDEVISRGHPVPPGRFYTDLLAASDPEAAVLVKRKRAEFLHTRVEDCTPARLAMRERVKLAQVGLLKRSL